MSVDTQNATDIRQQTTMGLAVDLPMPEARRRLRYGNFLSRVVLLVVSLVVVYSASSLTTEVVGAAPGARNTVIGRLNRDHTYGQTFAVERDDLVAIRVLLFANPTDRDDQVTLRLRFADGAMRELAVAQLPIRALAGRKMATFSIRPLTFNFPAHVLTARLRLDLEAPTLAPTEWITVIGGPDTYPEGTLFVNGVPRSSADLAFQPIYQRRWFDTLLPISRMAHGKPGILGRPQLYAVLAYLYCVLLVSAILRLWRVVRDAVDAH